MTFIFCNVKCRYNDDGECMLDHVEMIWNSDTERPQCNDWEETDQGGPQ